MSSARRGLTVEVHQGNEPVGFASNDGDCERQAERAGSHNRLWGAAHGYPYGQGGLDRAGVNALVVQVGAVASRPCRLFGVTDREEQLQLFRKKRVVIVQRVPEKGERLREGPSAGHDLSASTGDEIQSREVLKYAYRVIRTQNGHSSAETDSFCACGTGSQSNGW